MKDSLVISEKTALIPDRKECNFTDTKNYDQIILAGKQSSQLRHYKIIRLVFMVMIVMIALFLMTYSCYLIAIQFLLNAAHKYNVRLISNDRIFMEIDVTRYEFNYTCSIKNPSILCLTENLDSIIKAGVTDLLLTNIFDNDYQLKPIFSDKNEFEKFLSSTLCKKIKVYIEIPQIKRSFQSSKNIDPQFNDTKFLEYASKSNKSCLDSYKTDYLFLIEEYSVMGVDGFILNELPCCLVFPEYFVGSCTFDSIFDFRRLARREGKPSAIVYRSEPKIDNSIIKELEKQKYSYFDSFIGYIVIEDDGNVETSPEAMTKLFPHTIWGLKIPKSEEISGLRYLYEAIQAFSTGATMYSPIQDTNSSDSNEDRISKQFHEDLKHLKFISIMKKMLLNTSCVSNASTYIPKYSEKQLYISVLPIKAQEWTTCLLVVNFGDKTTDINARLHLSDSSSKAGNGIALMKIEHDGTLSTMPEVKQTSFSIPKKSAMVIKISKDS